MFFITVTHSVQSSYQPTMSYQRTNSHLYIPVSLLFLAAPMTFTASTYPNLTVFCIVHRPLPAAPPTIYNSLPFLYSFSPLPCNLFTLNVSAFPLHLTTSPFIPQHNHSVHFSSLFNKKKSKQADFLQVGKFNSIWRLTLLLYYELTYFINLPIAMHQLLQKKAVCCGQK